MKRTDETEPLAVVGLKRTAETEPLAVVGLKRTDETEPLAAAVGLKRNSCAEFKPLLQLFDNYSSLGKQPRPTAY